MSSKELERHALIKRVVGKESSQSLAATQLSLSDRHCMFANNKDRAETPTRFGRAYLQLEIRSILVLSPQAKGRVERLFPTLQGQARQSTTSGWYQRY